MTRVVVLAFDGISPFHLAIPSTVFGDLGALPARYEVMACAERPGTIATQAGYEIVVRHGLETLISANTLVIPSWTVGKPVSTRLTDAVRDAHRRGARIVGLCLGAWVVAASGIADGRVVATHWAAADALSRAYPAVTVRTDALWYDLGDVITSAGVAAGLDTCLHVVRSDHGSAYASALARRLVTAPHRVGSQAQFIPAPLAPSSTGDAIDEAMSWAHSHLDEPIDLVTWSRTIHLSVRSFSRQFSQRTGVSPGRWLLERRLDRARILLETTRLGVDRVAVESGIGSATTLRHHFARRYGISPTAHRDAFRAETPLEAHRI